MSPRPTKGICRACGCTWDTPCPGGCAWTDRTETLCTSCVRPARQSHRSQPTRPARKPFDQVDMFADAETRREWVLFIPPDRTVGDAHGWVLLDGPGQSWGMVKDQAPTQVRHYTEADAREMAAAVKWSTRAVPRLAAALPWGQLLQVGRRRRA